GGTQIVAIQNQLIAVICTLSTSGSNNLDFPFKGSTVVVVDLKGGSNWVWIDQGFVGQLNGTSHLVDHPDLIFSGNQTFEPCSGNIISVNRCRIRRWSHKVSISSPTSGCRDFNDAIISWNTGNIR